jgi:L-arabinokinase
VHSVLYYVSGHGYGHARRSAEVIRALRATAPDLNVYVRTSAPDSIFGGLTAGAVASSAIDTPVVERDALSIDWPATLAGAADLLRRRRAAVARETEGVRDLGASLVLSDVPFLAGDVAAALGVPCVAVSNFTWDWIYETHRAEHPDGAAVVRGARSSYAQMAVLLQLPFGHDTEVFPQVIPVPLVARRSTLPRAQVLERVGLDPADSRPRVLLGLRGGIDPATIARAAEACPDYLFVRIGNEHPAISATNVRQLRLEPPLDFSDLLAASDVVLSKLGYGTIAECIANRTRLVWPARSGFREDVITRAEAPRYLRMWEMPLEEFQAGRWKRSLDLAMSLPEPAEQLPLDGAAACADFITSRLG